MPSWEESGLEDIHAARAIAELLDEWFRVKQLDDLAREEVQRLRGAIHSLRVSLTRGSDLAFDAMARRAER